MNRSAGGSVARQHAAVCVLLLLAIAPLVGGTVPAVAQNDNPAAEPGTPKPAPKKHPHKPAKPVRQAQQPTPAGKIAPPAPKVAPPVPSAAPPPPPPQAAAPPPQPITAAVPANAPAHFTTQLQQAGTRTCLPQIERVAAASMQAVTAWNTVSNWMTGGADTHAVSLFLGQQYGGNPNVPFGVTGVFAAPSEPGKCDAMSVQVVPSPLPCAKLRESLQAAKGRQIGDLAGIPLMQDPGGQTMLVPTGANGCVLVALRTAYAK